MKPPPFEMRSPASIDEALELLEQHGGDSRVLAGGQSLVPLLNFRLLRPEILIDIGRCRDQDKIADDATHVRCAAMVRQTSAERSPIIAEKVPLLSAALPYVGATATRNRGTVCGSIAHADRLAELPCVAIALNASIELASRSHRRTLDATEFFVSDLETAVGPEEMVVSVRWPVAEPRTLAIFLEIGNRRHGFALAGVAAQAQFDGEGIPRAVRIAAMGGGDVPIRLHELEALVTGARPEGELLAEAARLARSLVDPDEDIHASVQYRRNAIGTLASRAIEQLGHRATRG